MLCSADQCTGCAACANSCPENAISMQMNGDGFFMPVVDEGKCIHCGICEKRCPIITPLECKNRKPVAYAAALKDQTLLHKSASGGAFMALAEVVIADHGVVYGAVWEKDFSVGFKRAASLEELAPMASSKYVSSQVDMTFRKIKKDLESGLPVLFSALPCQIGGLYGYLGKKEYPNLYTAELICHGGGSPGIFQEYMKNEHPDVVSINQRYKASDWTQMIQFLIQFAFSDGHKKELPCWNDSYLYGFLTGTLYKESCPQCAFAKLPRTADLSLGDCMGIGMLYKKPAFPLKNGVSLILVNNRHGQTLFEKAAEYMQYEERPLIESVSWNLQIWRPQTKSPFRDKFFYDHARGMSYPQLAKKYLGQNLKAKVKLELRTLLKFFLRPEGSVMLLYWMNRRKGFINKVKQIIDNLPKDEKNE